MESFLGEKFHLLLFCIKFLKVKISLKFSLRSFNYPLRLLVKVLEVDNIVIVVHRQFLNMT